MAVEQDGLIKIPTHNNMQYKYMPLYTYGIYTSTGSCVPAAAPHFSKLITHNVQYVVIATEEWQGLNYDLHE